jgi:hypothetical protein
MRRVFRWIVALLLILSVAVIGARTSGSTRPLEQTDLFRVLFANSDGSPCYELCLFGIYPADVKQAEDQQRLAQLPWMREVTLRHEALSGWFDVTGTSFTFYANSTYVAVYEELDDNFVAQPIAFARPTLGDVFVAFGSPTFMNMSNRGVALWVDEEKILVWTYFDTSITPRLPIYGIIIFLQTNHYLMNFRIKLVGAGLSIHSL